MARISKPPRRLPRLTIGANPSLSALVTSPGPPSITGDPIAAGVTVRSAPEVVRGLGLPDAAEQPLLARVLAWMDAPDRSRAAAMMMDDLRAAFPRDVYRRQEVKRRAWQLWDLTRAGAVNRMMGKSMEGGSWLELDAGVARSMLASDLLKGVGHKYIRRVPTGKKKPKYRYFYDVTGGAKLGHEDEFKVGAKFKVDRHTTLKPPQYQGWQSTPKKDQDEGKPPYRRYVKEGEGHRLEYWGPDESKAEGHYEILKVGPDKVRVRHDETRKVTVMSKDALRQLLHETHDERIKERGKRLKRDAAAVQLYGSEKQQKIVLRQAADYHEHFGHVWGVYAEGPDSDDQGIPDDASPVLRQHYAALKQVVALQRQIYLWTNKWREFGDSKRGTPASGDVPPRLQASAKAVIKLIEETWHVKPPSHVGSPQTDEEKREFAAHKKMERSIARVMGDSAVDALSRGNLLGLVKLAEGKLQPDVWTGQEVQTPEGGKGKVTGHVKTDENGQQWMSVEVEGVGSQDYIRSDLVGTGDINQGMDHRRVMSMEEGARKVIEFFAYKVARDEVNLDAKRQITPDAAIYKAALLDAARRNYYSKGRGKRNGYKLLRDLIGKTNTRRGLRAARALMSNIYSGGKFGAAQAAAVMDWDDGYADKKAKRTMRDMAAHGWDDLEYSADDAVPALDKAINQDVELIQEHGEGVLVSLDDGRPPRTLQSEREGKLLGHRFSQVQEAQSAVKALFHEQFGVRVHLEDGCFDDFVNPVVNRKEGWGGLDRYNLQGSTKKVLERVDPKDHAQVRRFLNMENAGWGINAADPLEMGYATKADKAAFNELTQATELSHHARRGVLTNLHNALGDMEHVMGGRLDLSGLPMVISDKHVGMGAAAHYSGQGAHMGRLENLDQASMRTWKEMKASPHIAIGTKQEKSLAHEIVHYLENRVSIQVSRVDNSATRRKLQERIARPADWFDSTYSGQKEFGIDEDKDPVRWAAWNSYTSDKYDSKSSDYLSSMCCWIHRARQNPMKMRTPEGVDPGTFKGWAEPEAAEILGHVEAHVREDIPGGAEMMDLFDAVAKSGMLERLKAKDDKTKASDPSNMLREAVREAPLREEESNYYQNGHEILARAAEQYAHHRLADEGVMNPTLTHLSYTGEPTRWDGPSEYFDPGEFNRDIAPHVKKVLDFLRQHMTKAVMMDRYDAAVKRGTALMKGAMPASAGPRGAAPGTVHTWTDGSQYKKQASGQWVEIGGPKKGKKGEPGKKPRAGAAGSGANRLPAKPKPAKRGAAGKPGTTSGTRNGDKSAKPSERQAGGGNEAGHEQPQVPAGADGLKAMMAAALQQYGAEAVAAATQEAMGDVAQHVDQEMGKRAGKVASSPAVQRVVQAHVGDGKGHGKFDQGKLQEITDALKGDEDVRRLATQELHQMAPGITEAAENAAVKAAGKKDSKTEPSKAKAVAKAILTGGAGSFVFGFLDNFIMLVAGSGIDSVLTHLGLGAAWTAGIGNAISDAMGQAGADKIEGVLDKIGLGEDQTTGALDEKTEARIKSVSSVAGVFVGALAGMIPLAFGVSFGKSRGGLIWFDGEPGEREPGLTPRLLLSKGKAGEGTRGGRVVGHSASGNPIYAQQGKDRAGNKVGGAYTIHHDGKKIGHVQDFRHGGQGWTWTHYGKGDENTPKEHTSGRYRPSRKKAIEAMVGHHEDGMGKSMGGAPELVIILVDMDLEKGAGHKYLKRVPTGKPKPKYRYIYAYPTRKKLVEEDHLVAGAKLKVEHAGHDGHFEVEHHDKEKGIVRLKHDESGKIAHIHVDDLHGMVSSYHKKKGTAEAQKKKRAAGKKKKPAKMTAADLPAQGEPTPPALKLRSPAKQIDTGQRIKPKEEPDKGPAPELPAIKLEDVGRTWEGILTVCASKEAADQAAHLDGKEGHEYAVVPQPGGTFVVAERKKVERTGSQREAVGASTVVKMRDGSGKGISDMEAEYVLMEADDVIASHNAQTMAPREDYPDKVQERRYHELVGEEMKVDRIARTMDPAIVANTNPDGVNGTPIITEDGVVLGGNGRSMAMQRAYANYPDSASDLKGYLEQQARAFGLSPAEVRGMKQPILVRRVKAGNDTEHLRALGRRMNQSLTQGMDPRTMAVVMAQNYVDERLVSALTNKIEPDQTLNDFLTSHDGKEFVVALTNAKIIDSMNRDEYVEVADPERPKATDGLLNEDGRIMVERVLAARFIEDPKLLSSMRPSLRANIAKCTPYLLRAAAAGWDVKEALKIAVGADVGNRGRKDRPTADKFLASPELAIPGEEKEYGNLVRKDPLAAHLFRMIQEPGKKEKGHNGPILMARGMREFARRAEQAEHTRAGSMFGESPEPPDHALDMSFGLSEEGQAHKKAVADEAKAEANSAAQALGFADAAEMAESKKKGKGKKKPAEDEGGLFASFRDPPTLIKAVADKDLPAYLMNAVVGEVRHLLNAKLHVAALNRGKLHVDKAEIQRKVLDMVTHAMVRDPDMARAVGAQPLEPGVMDGLIEAMVQQYQGKMSKACRYWWGRRSGTLCKGGTKPAERPPGAGWTPIPHSKRGGFRKMHNGGWMYWYKDQDTHQRERMITGNGLEEVPVAPGKLDERRALHEAESMMHMDDVHRALVVAERVHRTHAAAAQHKIYGKMMRELPDKIAGIKKQIERTRDVHRVHQLQEKARTLALATFKEARQYEEKQGGLFGDDDTKLPDRKEMTAGQVEHHAQKAAGLYGQGKDRKARDSYIAQISEKHGPGEAEKVYHRGLEYSAAKQKGVKPKLTIGKAPAKGVLHPGAPKPEKPKPKAKEKKPKREQGSLFDHNTLLGDAAGQRKLPGMGGGLFG
jgi:hypothetical protein